MTSDESSEAVEIEKFHADTALAFYGCREDTRVAETTPQRRWSKPPSPHSIISSAPASRETDTLMPRTFTVFKLTISSKLVGCSTGISAGAAA
jgi:hypothetical protein